MSFLSEIKRKSASLNHTSTRVTTIEGKTLLEERVQGVLRTEEIMSESPSCPGFVVDSKPDLQVAEIIPSLLYLGSQDVTQDAELIKHYGITNILSIGISVPQLSEFSNLNYHYVPALDVPEENIDAMLNIALPLMKSILHRGNRMFVHCNAGVSRAPTVVMAYLIAHEGYSFNKAFSIVKSKRPAANPNHGFLHQLLELEKKIMMLKTENE